MFEVVDESRLRISVPNCPLNVCLFDQSQKTRLPVAKNFSFVKKHEVDSVAEKCATDNCVECVHLYGERQIDNVCFTGEESSTPSLNFLHATKTVKKWILIKAVQKNPCLYDKSKMDYQNWWAKEKSWNYVAK